MSALDELLANEHARLHGETIPHLDGSKSRRERVVAAAAELAALRERAESAEKWTCVRCNTKHDAATDEMGPPYVYCHGCERERAERREAWSVDDAVRALSLDLPLWDSVQEYAAACRTNDATTSVRRQRAVTGIMDAIRTALRRVAGEEQNTATDGATHPRKPDSESKSASFDAGSEGPTIPRFDSGRNAGVATQNRSRPFTAGGDASTREGEVGEASHLSNVSPALSRFVEAGIAIKNRLEGMDGDNNKPTWELLDTFDDALAEIGKAAP